MKLYQVVFGNYFPQEVDSSWGSRALADARLAELEAGDDSGMWEVVESEVHWEHKEVSE